MTALAYVFATLGLAPGSPSSAFLFRVGTPDDATGFVAFDGTAGFGFGFGFGAGDEDTGGFEAGEDVFGTGPSLPTDASSAANCKTGISMTKRTTEDR